MPTHTTTALVEGEWHAILDAYRCGPRQLYGPLILRRLAPYLTATARRYTPFRRRSQPRTSTSSLPSRCSSPPPRCRSARARTAGSPPPHQPRPHHARPVARPRARRAPRRARAGMRSDPASASSAQRARSSRPWRVAPCRLARPKVGTGRPACSFKCVRHRRGHQGRSAPPAVVCPAGKTLTPVPAADLPLAFRDRAPQIRPGGMQ